MSNRQLTALVLFALLHIVAALGTTSPSAPASAADRAEEAPVTAADRAGQARAPGVVTPQSPLAQGRSTICASAARGLR